MECITPLNCSSGKGRKCTLYFFRHETINIYQPQPHGRYRNMKRMVLPLIPYKLEKLVKKQHLSCPGENLASGY